MDTAEIVIEQLARNAKILPARAKGNCRIWFMFMDKPVFLSAGSRKEKEAREAKVTRIREWYAKLPKATPTGTPAATSAAPWATWVDKFLRFEHKRSKEGYRDGVAQVLRDFGKAAGDPDVWLMTKDRFREVWETVEADKAPHTQANWLGILGGFARFLEEEIEGYHRDFTRGVKRPPKNTFGKREAVHREDAFHRTWIELPLWVRPIWEDHWFTAMDTKDLWEFQPRKHCVLTEGEAGPRLKIWKQRAKEVEIIDQPVSTRIHARWLAKYNAAGPETYMYEDARKQYASEKSWGGQVRKAIYAAQHRAGLPKMDIKSTRHTFATRHLLRLIRGEKNAPTLDQIRRWMGHAPDSRVLERLYLKLMSLPHLMD